MNYWYIQDDTSKKYFAEWKKPGDEEHILYDSMYMKFCNSWKQSLVTEANQWLPTEVGGEHWLQRAIKEFVHSEGNVLYFDCVGGHTVHTFLKIYWFIHLKWVKLIIH